MGEFTRKLHFLYFCDVSAPKEQRSDSQEGTDSFSLLTMHLYPQETTAAERSHSRSAQSIALDTETGETPKPGYSVRQGSGRTRERWAEGTRSLNQLRTDLLWRFWFPWDSSAGRCSAEPHKSECPFCTNTGSYHQKESGSHHVFSSSFSQAELKTICFGYLVTLGSPTVNGEKQALSALKSCNLLCTPTSEEPEGTDSVVSPPSQPPNAELDNSPSFWIPHLPSTASSADMA